MTRETYRADLDRLRADVLTMGDDVLNQVDTGLRALTTGDEELARTVIESDDPINDAYLDIEAACIDLFALQQPVASDLRFVAASFKIATDLERVGDLATNLGKYALTAETEQFPEVDVATIGAEAQSMLVDALDAYDASNADVCFTIEDRDKELDARCQQASEQVVRELIEGGAGDAWDIERVLDDVSRILLTVRDLERVGDHAVNIAARTLYMVENDPTLIY